MIRKALLVALMATAAAPAGAAADPSGTDQKNAAKQCKAERASLGKDAFARKYGTNKNKRNAFGKCVSRKARKIEAKREQEAKRENARRENAARKCKAERETLGEEEFAKKYGTNKNRRNAFGKCVSKLAGS
jgi:hypothetical protein